MKIQCDHCDSVFLIDDSLISDKGVKAQCPRCAHQKVIWKDQSAADPFAKDPSQEFVDCFSCGRPMQAPDEDSILPICENCLVPGQDEIFESSQSYKEKSQSIEKISSPSLLSQEPVKEQQNPTPYGDLLSAPLEEDSSEDILRVSENAAKNRENRPSNHIYSDSLSKGRIDKIPGPPREKTPFTAKAETGLGHIKLDEFVIRNLKKNVEIGPVSLKELCTLYAKGKISTSDQYQSIDGSWHRLQENKELIALLRRTPQIKDSHRKSSSPAKVLMFMFFILLFAGGAWYASTQIDFEKFLAKRSTKNPKGRTHFNRPPLDEKVEEWKKLLYPKLQFKKAETKKYTKSGFRAFYKDTKADYKRAIKFFQKALICDRKNLEAVVGLSNSLLWLNYPSPPSTRDLNNYLELIRYARSRRKRTAILEFTYQAYKYQIAKKEKRKIKMYIKTKKMPKHPLALLLGSELLLQTKDSDHKKIALQWLEKLVQAKSNARRGRLLLAKQSFQKHEPYKTRSLLLPLLKAKHPRGMFLMAKLQMNMGRFSSGASYLKKLLRNLPKSSQATTVGNNARLLLAKYYLQIQRNYRKANQILTKLYIRSSKKASPDQSLWQKRTMLYLGYLLLLKNKTGRVKNLLAKLKQKDNTFPHTKLLAAEYYHKIRQPRKALKALKDFLAGRHAPDVNCYYAMLLEKSGKVSKARKIYQRLISTDNNNIWPYLLLAASTLQEDKSTNTYRQGFIWMRKSLELEPSYNRNARRIRNDILLPPNRFRWVLQRLRRAKLKKIDEPLVIATQGIAAYHLGLRSISRGLLKKSLQKDHQILSAKLYLAQIAFDQGKNRQAKSFASSIKKTYRGEHAIINTILGWLALRKKRYHKAQQYFQKVEEESKADFFSAKIGKAKTLIQAGKREKALNFLQDVLNKHQHHGVLRTLYELKR